MMKPTRSRGRRRNFRRSRIQCGTPVDRLKPAIAPDHRVIQTTLLQAVIRKASFIREPLLVDVLVQSRGHSHYFVTPSLHPDVRANGVGNVDRFRLPQFPSAGTVFVRFRV